MSICKLSNLGNIPAWIAGAVLAAALTSGSASAITIDVFPSSAPNFFGGPSFATYNTNALNSIENGLGTTGDPTTDPTAYKTKTTFGTNEIVVSNFNSWGGIANPGVPFTSEFGNRLHFGLHILGQGTQFRLDNLAFVLDSTDSGDILDFAGNFTGGSYNQFRVGIDYVDGIKGNGNDIIITSGLATQLVNELIYVGVGNAFDASFEPGTNQEKLDSVISFADDEAPFTMTTTYTLFADNKTTVLQSGSATATITDVPEPATLAMFGIGLAGLGFMRRKRVA